VNVQTVARDPSGYRVRPTGLLNTLTIKYGFYASNTGVSSY
jgi:hypothetical protein